jgi:threonine/homoserine/homoserine lactone efflux protein
VTTLFLSSLVLGIAFCAPPGIITAEAIRRGLTRGFRPALLVELGSLIGDATWAIITLAGAAFVVQNMLARLALGIIGTLFLLHLAWNAIWSAKQGVVLQSKNATGRGDFATGAVLSLGNPFAVAFWLGVGSSTITTHVPNPHLIHFVIFFCAFMLGGLAWCFFLAGLITWGRRFVTPAFFRGVNLLCGLFLGYFGLQLLWNTLHGLLI